MRNHKFRPLSGCRQNINPRTCFVQRIERKCTADTEGYADKTYALAYSGYCLVQNCPEGIDDLFPFCTATNSCRHAVSRNGSGVEARNILFLGLATADVKPWPPDWADWARKTMKWLLT
jgi:hypothetical protein